MTPLGLRVAEARRLLHGHYGFRDFRPLQRRVVQSVLAGRDTLAVLPTGGGKSICFQVPALVLGGLTLVVSPLVALMQDQVRALVQRGIAAATLNALMPAEAQAAVLARVSDGSLRLLYVSPERASTLGLELLRRGVRPVLLAIDEAHCITEWGHDFRPSYRHLGQLRLDLGRPPLVALTGSATAAVRQDVIESLALVRPDCHLGSFDRPNLHLGVEFVRDPSARLTRTRELLAPRPGLAIVYVSTRNAADAMAQALWFSGHRAAPYHAGLSRERREEVLEKFIREELDVVVATSAFGMGIDAPRVRLVVHCGMPATPESYYQEAGRAGRDGLPSRCVLLHHLRDAETHRRQLDVTFPPRKVLEAIWHDPTIRGRHPRPVVLAAERLRAEMEGVTTGPAWERVSRRRRAAADRVAAMEGYAIRARCRRRTLLEYFGEEREDCGGCDVCTAPPAARVLHGFRDLFRVF